MSWFRDLVHVLSVCGLREFVVGRVADSHGERIAAERRAVHAADHAFRGFLGGENAPIGKPPPTPLATAMMSGETPAHWWAHILPVRLGLIALRRR